MQESIELLNRKLNEADSAHQVNWADKILQNIICGRKIKNIFVVILKTIVDIFAGLTTKQGPAGARPENQIQLTVY